MRPASQAATPLGAGATAQAAAAVDRGPAGARGYRPETGSCAAANFRHTARDGPVRSSRQLLRRLPGNVLDSSAEAALPAVRLPIVPLQHRPEPAPAHAWHWPAMR